MITRVKNTHSGSTTNTKFGELSKKINGTVNNVPFEITEKHLRNDRGSEAVKRYQKYSQPIPVIGPITKSKSDMQLAVSPGI